MAEGVGHGGPAGSRAFDEALSALRAGRAVVLPTDTVYGLGVAVAHAPRPDELFRLKGRPSGKAIPWLVASLSDLAAYGDAVPDYARDLARDGWPGPLTLVVRASDAVPAAYRGPKGTIALRMPASPEPLALMDALGCPLAVTSANLSGRAPVDRLAIMDAGLLAMAAAVLPGEEPLGGEPSAIVDCTGLEPRRLR